MRLPMMNDKIIDSDFDGFDNGQMEYDDEIGEFVPVYNDDLELLGEWQSDDIVSPYDCDFGEY